MFNVLTDLRRTLFEDQGSGQHSSQKGMYKVVPLEVVAVNKRLHYISHLIIMVNEAYILSFIFKLSCLKYLHEDLSSMY